MLPKSCWNGSIRNNMEKQVPPRPRIHMCDYVSQVTDLSSLNARRAFTSEWSYMSTKALNWNTHSPIAASYNCVKEYCVFWYTCLIFFGIYGLVFLQYCKLSSKVPPWSVKSISEDIIALDVFSGQSAVSNAFGHDPRSRPNKNFCGDFNRPSYEN